ncbi:hypothetical protein Bhyg_12541, partial [Pseudolycoriella hygida]
MVKQWKKDGPEQELLERMFDEGSIEDWETSDVVQSKVPQFKLFSERVFAKHFRETKLGSYPGASQIETQNSIPELGHPETSSHGRPADFTALDGSHSDIRFGNAPYITWIYTDHQKNVEYVCVAVCVISGCRDINFIVSDDGTKLTLNYVWPSAIYSPEELFANKLLKNEMSLDHPKIHALNSRLIDREITLQSRPQGSMTIDLPKKVLREIGTWSKTGVKSKETRIVLLEFQAFQK